MRLLQHLARMIQLTSQRNPQEHKPMFRLQSPAPSRVIGLMALAACTLNAQAGFVTAVTPYTVPVSPDYTIMPILSVGDRVPRTSNPLQQYQMVGIPDGLGAHRNADG